MGCAPAPPESHGSYANPIRWTMTAADVVQNGESSYCGSVRAWALSLLAGLRSASNF